MVAMLLLFLPLYGVFAAAAQPGQVRVLLTQWSGADTLDVGVWGAYAMDEAFSFQRGASIRLHEQNGRVMAYYEGMAYRGGETVKLLRHISDESLENGVRLEGRLNLLEGDLLVSAVNGQLQAVLHIGIEDYLKGVVPYEMSDDFPKEALKAQAVAARTYTLRALDGSRAYDVVDNTNDQVFRGTLEDQVKAQQAVRETAGSTLMYEGRPANAYYTASNGGQTESAYHAWGREHIAYLQVRDDPYDAANTLAEVRKLFLPKVVTQDSALHPWLSERLMQSALPSVKSLGYDDKPENVKITGFRSVEAIGPQFPGESRLMTKVRFDLNISARRPQAVLREGEVALFSSPVPTQTPAPGGMTTAQPLGPFEAVASSVRVELPLYPEMEQALGLSINIKQNETVTVTENPDGFLLQTARYGHGVGMSQRGAEWMAGQHGMSYKEILAFYYPGTALERQNTTPQAREPLDRSYLSTPGPRPTATPKPTLVPVSATPGPGQYMVAVTGVARNSSLNLRAEPNTGSDVLYQLYYGQRLLVLSKAGEEWLQVEADGLKGYVMARFVSAE